MTKQELINTLEWFKNQAINLRDNGEDQNMDWGSLIDDINDTFKYVEIEDNYDDEGPEYDSAGFTEDDRIVNGQYRVISNKDKDDWLENRLSEDSFPHYVTNEEADEDYKASLMQDEQRYNNQHK